MTRMTGGCQHSRSAQRMSESNLVQLFGEMVMYLSMIAVKRPLRSLTASGAAYPLATGARGTGRMISEATFQSSPTFIQFIIIKNGLGVPSCPA
jgi:hypothetical protein